MAARYSITSNGSPLLDVTSASVAYTSGVMDISMDTADVYIEFFDSSGNPATPTAGQVFIYGLPTGTTWLAAYGSPIDATKVTRPVATYTPPLLDGLCIQAQAQFTGITGATRASVTIYKRGN